MSKSTVSVVRAWKDYGRIHIEITELGILLSISSKQHPETYRKALDWLNSDRESHITPTEEDRGGSQ